MGNGQMHFAGSPALASRSGTGSIAFIVIALIVSLFFLWGVANNLNDILIKQFKKAFELSDFQAGLVQSAFYMGYFVLAIPASICMRKFGYKAALLVGLCLYAAGAFLFYPAAAAHAYSLFLGALFIIASGLAFLETSANPLMTVLGPSSSAARRLNLAQSFNPLGSITGVLIGQHFILSGIEHRPADLAAMTDTARQAYYASESAAVQIPYLVIGSIVLVWAVLIAIVRFPEIANVRADEKGGGFDVGHLAHNRIFVLSVVAQFFYVGAQIGMWSFLIRYAQATVPGTPEKSAATFLTLSLVLFMFGRFTGTALMRYIAAERLLAIFGVVNICLVALSVLHPGQMGINALVAASFFMSVMFPTIFALGLRGLGDEDRKLGSSFLVMSIIGGAILTAVMGAVSDAAGIHHAMLVPIFSFAVVVIFALRAQRSEADG
jgi:FHS family L-fucose permease-like MFS transporter